MSAGESLPAGPGTGRLAIAILAAAALASLVGPPVWRQLDPELRVTPPGGYRPVVVASSLPHLAPEEDPRDPWGRRFLIITAIQPGRELGRHLLGRSWDPAVYEVQSSPSTWTTSVGGHVRACSSGPDGIGQLGGGDDAFAPHPDDPKLLLWQASPRLIGCAMLGLGLLLGLLVEGSARTRLRQGVMVLTGATGTLALAGPSHEVWALVQGHVPFSLLKTALTAALGGAVFGLALALRAQTNASRAEA